MYDPKLGRMLSPDIIVQDGGNTQCYNRYSYCVNNPLAYTDPSGYEAQCYLDDLMFWRAYCASAPTMRNDAMYNLSLGGSVFNYIAGLSGNEYNTGAPTGGDYTNYVNSGNTNGFGNWFKQQTTANFNQPRGGNGGYWMPLSLPPTIGFNLPDNQGNLCMIPQVGQKWVMTNNNTTTSGGDGNINYPFGPYTSWIGVVGAITDFSRNPNFNQTKYFNKVPKGTDAAVNAILKNTSKTLKTIGWIGEGISISVSSINFFNNPTPGNCERLNSSLSSTMLNFYGPAGPALSFIMSGADASGYFNSQYDALDNLQKQQGIGIYRIGGFMYIDIQQH